MLSAVSLSEAVKKLDSSTRAPQDLHILERSEAHQFTASSSETWAKVNLPAPQGGSCCPEEWRFKTGVDAATTRFLIVMPVHNEEEHIVASLSALLLNRTPVEADISVLVIFNGCGDHSEARARALLSRFARIDKVPAPCTGTYPLNPDSYRAELPGMRIDLLSSSKQGKASALNCANRIALERGYPLVICADSDMMLGIESLALIYEAAHERILSERATTKVLCGVRWKEFTIPGFRERVLGALQEVKFRIIGRTDSHVTGALMAWDPVWMNEQGGVPRCPLEDVAVGVLCRRAGLEVGFVDAPTWGYKPNSPSDWLSLGRRIVRALYHIRELQHGDKHGVETCEKLFPVLRSYDDRWRAYIRTVLRHPFGAIEETFYFCASELLMRIGRRDFQRERESESWQKLHSARK